MVFSGILFLYYFLPAVLLVYYILPRKLKNTALFISSLVFYAWGEPVYIFLMLFSILFNYVMAIIMDRCGEKKTAKTTVLTVTVALDLSILVFYKYVDFFIASVNSVFGLTLPFLNIPLPIGISFYTFQIISYVVDVYRNNAKVQKNFISIGTYIALFPQLIAGPIVRYSSVDEQLSKRKETFDMFADGVGAFCVGLSKKVLLANNFGLLWQASKGAEFGDISAMSAWLGIIAFTLQIYFDFSGYSDMAVGLGKMFGFNFEINFNYPYISKSVTEFWRRWHISLGTWFREYVYIPLGGNRKGYLRTFFNLLIVWFLTGLWHGASYNFIVWGIYYGVLLIVEKAFLLKLLRKIPKIFGRIYTLLAIVVGWVIFDSDTLGDACEYLKIMFCGKNFFDSGFLYDLRSYAVILPIAIIAVFPFGKNIFCRIPKKIRGIVMVLLSAISLYVCTAYLLDSTYNPFLYFRF